MDEAAGDVDSHDYQGQRDKQRQPIVRAAPDDQQRDQGEPEHGQDAENGYIGSEEPDGEAKLRQGTRILMHPSDRVFAHQPICRAHRERDPRTVFTDDRVTWSLPSPWWDGSAIDRNQDV